MKTNTLTTTGFKYHGPRAPADGVPGAASGRADLRLEAACRVVDFTSVLWKTIVALWIVNAKRILSEGVGLVKDAGRRGCASFAWVSCQSELFTGGV
ncbi:MAG: hypothetical protein KAY37_06765, partial [Phycisphaerae bacterium]|nr:hypothetical protein [Phycisphaerae bacterium]